MKYILKTAFIFMACILLVACGVNETENVVQGENEETFASLETDVIQVGNNVDNIEVMEQFVEDSGSEKESEIRYVIFENESAEPAAVYTLKSRTDSEAGLNWVEISRDWDYDAEGYDLIEPQQCSSVSKDTERGAYYLNECFHKWEIELMSFR